MSSPDNQASSDKREAARRAAADRRGAQAKDFNDRQFIFREHETGQEAFIVKSGRVEIFKTITQDNVTREVSLGILQPGTMFGEMALIDNKPRMASARAHKGAVTVLVVTQKQFSAMLDPVNPFVKKLLEILANHVRTSSQQNQTAAPSPTPTTTETASAEDNTNPEATGDVAAESAEIP